MQQYKDGNVSDSLVKVFHKMDDMLRDTKYQEEVRTRSSCSLAWQLIPRRPATSTVTRRAQARPRADCAGHGFTSYQSMCTSCQGSECLARVTHCQMQMCAQLFEFRGGRPPDGAGTAKGGAASADSSDSSGAGKEVCRRVV